MTRESKLGIFREEREKVLWRTQYGPIQYLRSVRDDKQSWVEAVSSGQSQISMRASERCIQRRI